MKRRGRCEPQRIFIDDKVGPSGGHSGSLPDNGLPDPGSKCFQPLDRISASLQNYTATNLYNNGE